jgi:hypothetical protein
MFPWKDNLGNPLVLNPRENIYFSYGTGDPFEVADCSLYSLISESVDDAFVSADAASANHGNEAVVRVGVTPPTQSYLRFNVQGLSSPVGRATLRMHTYS